MGAPSSGFPFQPVGRVARDSAGFTQSFSASEGEGIRGFFDRYGFVVVRDALTQLDCRETLAEIWAWIEKGSVRSQNSDRRVDRRDVSTWFEENGWPNHNLRAGLLSDSSWFTRQFLLNRQSPVLYEVCKSLIGCHRLVASHDRAALFRPTRTERGGRAAWATSLNLHFDLNPWSYFKDPPSEGRQLISSRYESESDFLDEHNSTGTPEDGPVCVQGLFNLIDNREVDGGFHCVPGMHRLAHAWASFSEEELGPQFHGNETHCTIHREWSGEILDQDPTRIHEHLQLVTSRAGSLILWSPLLPHGSAPNDSTRLRTAQFLKVAPTSAWTRESLRFRVTELHRRIGSGVPLTALGERMLGLAPWPETAR